MLKINRSILLLLTVLIGFSSCKDDDASLTPEEQLKIDTNNWLYDIMKEVYYWTDEIPADVDKTQEPEDLFYELLYQGDRFSVIVPNYEELINSLSGVSKDAGYEFALARVEDSNDVVAIVLYVKDNSSAKSIGLKRGDVIYQINGTTITLSNYQTLVPEIYNNHSISYRRYNDLISSYEDKGTANLTAVVLAENPNLMDTVFTIGDRKIGYYVYNFFSPGPTDAKAYDAEMDQIIASFKSAGVNEMILDLRYNSGGSVSSATNLASLLAPGISTSSIFYQNQWNDLYQNYIESQPDGDDILRGKFLSKADNIGSDIGGRLYVLTGSRTASASELIINGLDPYMDVTIIGDTTVGKNVGSIPIEDQDNEDNEYGILPIVFKIFNSEMYSGYDNGFSPLGDNLVNDFQYPMKALGDIEEPLLARAIELIQGSSTGGRQARATGEGFTPIMTSVDKKQRTNRLILDRPLK
ncbi:S41 family peptidase [Fulvivirga ulvae]|uniref:S41 family peptidase n=1 Tax=Fulvivirga ulvae TaxID=2904245 RepID=UPI001F4614F5|nr:S41 family peptidase [Fulvivirga ulvae]UII32379.1 S41 family peptidase [Fulvivirga ulvae]